MSNNSLLKSKAKSARKNVLKVVHHAGAGHIGGPLSAIDILTTLYFQEMNIDPSKPKTPNRDRFVLSKGHSAIGLYCVLAEKGFIEYDELFTFDSIDSRLQGHPDMNALEGIEMSTGSLGQGISAAVGMALGAKLKNEDFRVYCMIGDGESQEGQVWEAAFIAEKYNLDNLVVIVDYNKLQQYGWPGIENDRLAPNDNLEEKWSAFGWHVQRIDGHSYDEISKALHHARSAANKPTVIIADTVKGKGISFMEGNYSWHSRVPTDDELAAAIEELDNVGGAEK